MKRFFYYIFSVRPQAGTYYVDNYTQREIELQSCDIGRKTIRITSKDGDDSVMTFGEFWACYKMNRTVFK